MVKSIPQPHAISTLARTSLLAGGAAWLLLGAVGCGNADPNMFGSGQLNATGSSNAGSVSVLAGSAGLAGSGGSPSGGTGSAGGDSSAGNTGDLTTAGSGGSGAGCAFSCGEGGRGGSGSAGAGGAAGDNAEAGSGSGSPECAALSTNATYSPATQHCYLVDTELRTFAAAQAHCKELNAHLVTLSSEAENDFAWSLHGDEHWIGLQDGKMPRQSGVGTYAWVTNEPLEYTNWSADQPNATKTECVEGGACYEHCVNQWKGGDHESQWNDRYCMHTIVSICEWDSVP